MLDWLFGRKNEDEDKPKPKSKPSAEQDAEDVHLP